MPKSGEPEIPNSVAFALLLLLIGLAIVLWVKVVPDYHKNHPSIHPTTTVSPSR